MRDSLEWPADSDEADGEDTITARAKRTLAEFAEPQEFTTLESEYALEQWDDDDEFDPTI